MKFKPGERARIVRAQNIPEAVGKECVVKGPAPDKDWPPGFNRHGEQAYYVDVPGLPSLTPSGEWMIIESSLEKIIPHGWEKTTWDQCPWQPARSLETT